MSGAMGGSGSSDPTAGLASGWAAQQLNSAQARPDEDKYKKKQQADSAFGNDPFGTNSGGGGIV